jgi:predicted small secreted protein
MTKMRSSIAVGLAMSVLILGLSACEKKEGPGERAGKEIDKAVENAGKKLEKAGQDIQDAAKNAKK